MNIGTEIIIKDREYDVEFEAENIETAYYDAGPYEFWGHRGYDRP